MQVVAMKTIVMPKEQATKLADKVHNEVHKLISIAVLLSTHIVTLVVFLAK